MIEATDKQLDLNFPLSDHECSIDVRLTDERMSDLISGVGNHANKLVLLASMKPETVYGMTGDESAHKLLQESQRGGRQDGWLPEYNVSFKYLSNSLAPIGLVAKEYINEQEGAIGYEITDTGRHIGVPLAGYLLDFAERHHLALSQIFGDTTSRNPDERAGGLRWNIFQGLATQAIDEQFSITELARSVGSDVHRTQNSLTELSEIGLVHYEPGTKRQPQTYQIDREVLEEQLSRMRTGRSREIAQLIIESDMIDCSVAELAEIVTKDGPESNTAAFRSTLKTVLKNWEKIGITQRAVEKSGDARVWVTYEQQVVLQELVQILDDIKSGDDAVLDRGRVLARDILNDPNRVAKLLSHEKEVSVHYHGQKNAKKRGARVLEILRTSGPDTGMTYEEIREELKRMGDIVSVKGVARVVKDQSGLLVIPSRSKRAYKVALPGVSTRQ